MIRCLENDSQECYKFISKNSLIKDKISSQFLDKIYGKLKKIKINQVCSKSNPEKVDIKELKYSPFIAKEHLKKIEEDNWSLIKRKCTLNDFTWTVHQYNSESNERFNELSVSRIAYILALHNYNDNVKLNIYLYPTKFKKEITRDKKWKPVNINGGMTSSTSSTRDVYVWRYEEMPKVVLHEMVHAMQIDDALFENNLSKRFINEFGLMSSNYINVFESYTEIVAGIMNIMLFCIENNKDNLYDLLNIERNWSLFQAAGVLKVSGYEDIEKFLGNKDKLIQETNVFSYYILRSAHMYSIEKYLKWMEENVEEGFRLKNEASDDYYELSMEAINNEEYKGIINEYIRIFDKLKDNEFVKKTMRMTAIEGKSKLDDSMKLIRHFFLKKIK